jgi:hypothetical protein
LILPLRYLDHGELHWACTMTHEALHLWAVVTGLSPPLCLDTQVPLICWVRLNGILHASRANPCPKLGTEVSAEG